MAASSPSRPARTVLALFAALVLDGCAGCSEECRDTKQGSEDCPCQSDQDCTTRLGEVLLCEEGICKPADPPDAPAQACDGDGDCDEGQLCGLGFCHAAPSCQRIDVTELRGAVRVGATLNADSVIGVSRDGCDHEIVAGAFTLQVSDISAKTGAATVTGDCSDGAWFASKRGGLFQCGTSLLIVAEGEPCLAGFPCDEGGTCVPFGSELDNDLGVCR